MDFQGNAWKKEFFFRHRDMVPVKLETWQVWYTISLGNIKSSDIYTLMARPHRFTDSFDLSSDT